MQAIFGVGAFTHDMRFERDSFMRFTTIIIVTVLNSTGIVQRR